MLEVAQPLPGDCAILFALFLFGAFCRYLGVAIGAILLDVLEEFAAAVFACALGRIRWRRFAVDFQLFTAGRGVRAVTVMNLARLIHPFVNLDSTGDGPNNEAGKQDDHWQNKLGMAKAPWE